MTPFGADPQVQHQLIASVTSPLGGDLGLNPDLSLNPDNPLMDHLLVGNGWVGSWLNGYVGDVYWTGPPYYPVPHSVTITMPAGTGAFYFYCADDNYSLFDTATAQNGVSISQHCANAPYYGFYGTNGDLISSITITAQGAFVVGEFGIAKVAPVPLPGALILGALGLTFAGWRLKRKTA
jgi:hypothetical protein